MQEWKVPCCRRNASFSLVGQVLGSPVLELLLLGVALDVLPQRAGVRVPLGAAHHLAFVRFLQRNTEFVTKLAALIVYSRSFIDFFT